MLCCLVAQLSCRVVLCSVADWPGKDPGRMKMTMKKKTKCMVCVSVFVFAEFYFFPLWRLEALPALALRRVVSAARRKSRVRLTLRLSIVGCLFPASSVEAKLTSVTKSRHSIIHRLNLQNTPPACLLVCASFPVYPSGAPVRWSCFMSHFT